MFNFIKYKYISILIALILMILGSGITYLGHGGFAHSLDFNGGLRVVVNFNKDTSREQIDTFFSKLSVEAVVLNLEKEKNQYQIDISLGASKIIEDVYLKSVVPGEMKEDSLINQFVVILKNEFKLETEQILSADQVGAIVGDELTSTGFYLVLSTLAIILVYVSFRFKFKFALGAILALTHDLILTIVFIGVMQIRPSIPIIAAILTILGYSINDTIVVFDRIRENSDRDMDHSLGDIINISIVQTLGRTINTSLATLISVVAIIIGGAVELYDFAYVLIFGIVIGTYSSIFIAAPIIEIYSKFQRRNS